ncbi:MAG: hypothetical protein K5774_07970 [Clostridia bacterium]|nr:hypothetical protein [Clostridia bacterium]
MAISSKSSLRDVIADERAVAIIDKYIPGFMEKSAQFGPVMGMKIGMLLRFPQVGLPKDQVQGLLDELDALDA